MKELTRRFVAAVPAAAIVAALPLTSPASPRQADRDAVFGLIEQHKALVRRANEAPGEGEEYEAACAEEEAALQALGDIEPSTPAGAAALLLHMAEVEGCFADPQSPMVRTMRAVARGLTALARNCRHDDAPEPAGQPVATQTSSADALEPRPSSSLRSPPWPRPPAAARSSRRRCPTQS